MFWGITREASPYPEPDDQSRSPGSTTFHLIGTSLPEMSAASQVAWPVTEYIFKGSPYIPIAVSTASLISMSPTLEKPTASAKSKPNSACDTQARSNTYSKSFVDPSFLATATLHVFMTLSFAHLPPVKPLMV